MVARAVWPINVGRQWHMADLFHHPPEIRQGTKTDGPLTEASAGQDLGLEFVLLIEEQTFPNSDLAPRPDQTLPVVRLLRNLLRKQDFHTPAQEIPGGGIAGAYRLCSCSGAVSEQARRKYPCVIEYEQVVGP